MPRTSLPEHAVTFKGIEQGILILLDKSFDFEKLIKKTIQKVKANKKFLSENALFITGADGLLDPDELGMARKMIRDKTKMEVLPLSPWETEIAPSTSASINESVPPTFVRNNLRAGQELHCEGDLILFGDANPGSKITAGGSVVVFGKIYGEVHAGEPENKKAFIVAESFDPMRLSIGGMMADHFLENRTRKQWVYVRLKQDNIEISSGEDAQSE